MPLASRAGVDRDPSLQPLEDVQCPASQPPPGVTVTVHAVLDGQRKGKSDAVDSDELGFWVSAANSTTIGRDASVPNPPATGCGSQK
jgi:hypothetical protein